MKLIKAIKLHRKLRIRQEVLGYFYTKWSREHNNIDFPNLNEYCVVNQAVRRLERKIPDTYFLLSDLFGGATSIKRASEKEINRIKLLNLLNGDTIDLKMNPGFKDAHF